MVKAKNYTYPCCWWGHFFHRTTYMLKCTHREDIEYLEVTSHILMMYTSYVVYQLLCDYRFVFFFQNLLNLNFTFM
jgi:hypothetical protein